MYRNWSHSRWIRVQNEKSKTTLFDNLTKDKITVLQKLSEKDYILITKTDKGGAAVMIDVKDCIREAEW